MYNQTIKVRTNKSLTCVELFLLYHYVYSYTRVNLAITIQYEYLFILYKRDLIWFCKNGISCKLILNSDFMYVIVQYNIIYFTYYTFSTLFVILQ